MLRTLAFLSAVCLATGAGAATTTPLDFQLLDSLDFVVETRLEGVLEDTQTLSGGSVDWIAPPPLVSGSAHFEVDLSQGRIAIASSGTYTAPVALGNADYLVTATLLPSPPRIQIDVPDFGESLTTIVILGESSFDLNRTGNKKGVLDADMSVVGFSSALLGADVAVDGRSGGFGVTIDPGEPDDFSQSTTLNATYHSFPAGDTIQLDLPISFRTSCNTLAGTATTCSLTWNGSAEFQLLALVPEAQNIPMTQCFDAIDNDLDGAIDLEDGNCSDPWDTTEGPPPPMTGGCGIGPELALALPLLLGLRQRRSAPA